MLDMEPLGYVASHKGEYWDGDFWRPASQRKIWLSKASLMRTLHEEGEDLDLIELYEAPLSA